MERRMYVVTGVSALLAISIACGRHGSTPVSPSSSAPASGDEEAGANGATLKVTAPTAVSPINNALLQGSTATLVCTAATGLYAGSTLAYDFELYDSNNVKIRTEVVAGTSWTVQGLDFDRRYTGRVRATSDGAFGPWSDSDSFSFQTPANVGFLRGNEMYDPLTNGRTVGEMHGPLTFIPGLGVKLETQLSYISYTLPQTLYEGEFSLIVTGMPANTDGDKTKLFAMGQNYDDIVTNERRMTVEKRGDPAGVVAWRFITHDDQIDTEGAEREYVDFQAHKTYFFQASWRNNFFNLLIREGGIDGPAIYNKGKHFSGRAYDPNPHVLYIGAPVGRSGVSGASVDQAIIRQVWVSGNPRPVFPGDRP